MILNKFLTLITAISLCIISAKAQQTAKVTSSGIGYLEYLPKGYENNRDRYPVVISLHGIKEKGTTSKDHNQIKTSVKKVANVGLPKYVKQGKQYPFILISPQLKSSHARWSSEYVMDVVEHVKKNLRIDESRIYLTGLSLGGYGVWTTVGDYPDVFAAVLPVCAGGNAVNRACDIAKAKVPIWGFHGGSDNVVSENVTIRMINAVNGCNPKPSPLAKTTIFPGMGHIIWDKVYKETKALDWMLGFRKGKSSTPDDEESSNKLPMAGAGADKTITLPVNSIVLQGSGDDEDGSVASYAWMQSDGPSKASLINADSKTLTASNLKSGTYTFRLTVKDNKGAEDTDDVKVNVKTQSTENSAPVPDDSKPSEGNQRPLANAGPDLKLKLPSTSATLKGSGVDKDGKIISYRWSKIAGPSANLNDPNAAQLRLSSLKVGRYYFMLTVKDNKGAQSTDKMLLVVSR